LWPLEGKRTGCCYTLWPLGIFYGPLALFVVIWYILTILVCLDQEKSGNPDQLLQLGY
jgi:hypothetical protein